MSNFCPRLDSLLKDTQMAFERYIYLQEFEKKKQKKRNCFILNIKYKF